MENRWLLELAGKNEQNIAESNEEILDKNLDQKSDLDQKSIFSTEVAQKSRQY